MNLYPEKHIGGSRRMSLQRLFISFLLISIVSTNIQTTEAFTSDLQRFPPINEREDCVELGNKDSNCHCETMYNEYQILCPKLGKPKLTMSIKPGPERTLKIACSQMNATDYTLLLPMVSLGKIRTVMLSDCPLPPERTPISKIFNNLGITSVSELFVDSFEKDANLTRLHLSGLPNLKHLQLSLRYLTRLSEDLFEDFGNLRWLNIANIRAYQELPKNLFAPLGNLLFLEIANNNITYLPAGIFQNQHQLKSLNVFSNQFRELNINIFEGLSNLDTLDLSVNNIETLQPNIFYLFTNLSDIHLSKNSFRQLPKGLFDKNKNLLKFRLLNNVVPLRTLPEGLLSNLPLLNEVRLTCDLEIIPEDVFANSSSITVISLKENRLQELPRTLLSDQRNLTNLDLSNNQLTLLPNEIFGNTRNLKVLRLSNNQLTEISNKIFSYLDKLEELYMDNNQLTSISYNAFDNTQGLRKLYLQNNNIGLDEPVSGEANSPFHNLFQLQVLNLRNNSIVVIYTDWRLVMTELQELDLSYNNISHIHFTDLQYLSRNELTVNLTHNQITSVDFMHIRLLSPRNSSQPLTVDLNNNPLHCDCALPDFVLFLREEIERELSRNIQVIANNLSCEQPENLRGKAIRDLSMTDLVCLLDHEGSEVKFCPSDCECLMRSFDRTLLIDCSNGNRTEIPQIPSAMERKLNSTELNMENNRLEELPKAANYKGYAEVTKLMLANNRLQKIDVTSLPSGLQYLDLRNNRLPVLNETVLRFFNRSHHTLQVQLSKNPWKCDCLATPLLQFAQKSYKQILDLDQMECVAPLNDRKFQSLTVSEICPEDQSLIIAMAVVIALLGFLIGLIAALYYKYQNEIKIWLYAHNMCLWFVTEEELDKDKKYDAFISYSHKDEDFVAKTLLPQLENGPVPFKICVHFRDFLVGVAIPDQIVRSVDDSRRTIVILSKHFIESVWARMEFRAAHQAALTEKRARVIVIMYSDIGNIDKLDKELQAYLKMNTYLEWGDPWFWEKLRYAMPHQTKQMKGLIKHHLTANSIDDKLELIKPSPVTPPLTTPPAEATKHPLMARINGALPQTAITIPNGKVMSNGHLTNGKLLNGHVNGGFIVNTNAKQSDV